MSHDHPSNSWNTEAHETTDSSEFTITAQRLADLEDEATPIEYRRSCLQQLQQRTCPDCGDEWI